MIKFILRNYAQISLLFCVFFVAAATIGDNVWLILLDFVASVFWANEFVKTIKSD